MTSRRRHLGRHPQRHRRSFLSVVRAVVHNLGLLAALVIPARWE
ncbi:hypothetical protein [Herbidospora mongoliensis]|nr:hypothetical protein [Herbidospora mongoliensis]